MRTKDKIDFLRILNTNLRFNPFYATLFEKVGEVLDKQIGEPLAQLSRVRSSMHIKRGDYIDHNNQRAKVAHIRRDIIDGQPMDIITLQLMFGDSVTITRRALQDRQILVDSAFINGFDYYSDFLSDEDYARINDYISEYWSDGGAENSRFIKFIGFIKNMRLDISPLWTRDQGDFANTTLPEYDFYEYFKSPEEVTNPISPDGSSGDEYLTAHVDMEYDAFATPNPDFNDLISLFYYFAPIHLVLHRIIGAFYIEVFTYNTLVAHKNIMEHSRYEWTPQTLLPLTAVATTPHYSVSEHAYLFLDDNMEEVLPDFLS